MTRASFAMLFAAASLALVISGCATPSTGPSLFMLDSGHPAAGDTQRDTAATLVVQPVTLAPYLDQDGIVYQTAPYRVVVANDNRWAAPLAGELTDSLYVTLSQRLDDVELERAATDGSPSSAYRLRTRVDEFIGHFDGSAHIAGQWSLVGPHGTTRATQSFERRVPLDEDGYAALVASLARGWRQIGADMAPALQQQLHDNADTGTR